MNIEHFKFTTTNLDDYYEVFMDIFNNSQMIRLSNCYIKIMSIDVLYDIDLGYEMQLQLEAINKDKSYNIKYDETNEEIHKVLLSMTKYKRAIVTKLPYELKIKQYKDKSIIILPKEQEHKIEIIFK